MAYLAEYLRRGGCGRGGERLVSAWALVWATSGQALARAPVAAQ